MTGHTVPDGPGRSGTTGILGWSGRSWPDLVVPACPGMARQGADKLGIGVDGGGSSWDGVGAAEGVGSGVRSGVAAGLDEQTCRELLLQTVFGAAKMVLETGQHPGALKDAVASPGGTTIAGLHTLERAAFRAAAMDAVEAATKRSQELGRKD